MRAALLLAVLAVHCSAVAAVGEKYRNLDKNPPPPRPQAFNPAAGVAPEVAARERNDAALQRAYAGDLAGALQLFEEAVKIYEHPEYISNVGVTLMRMGRAWDAKAVFERALRIQPDFQNAVQNLDELVTWMKQQGMLPMTYSIFDGVNEGMLSGVKVVDLDFDDEEPTPAPAVKRRRSPATTRSHFGYLEHHTEPLPRVALMDLDSQAAREYAFGKRPFVVTGLRNVSAWAASKALNDWDFQYFRDNYGEKIVDFYPHNMAVETVKPFFASLASALQEAKHPSGQYRTNPDKPGTYIQWNVNMDDWKHLLQQLGPIPAMFLDFETWMAECFDTPQLRNAFTHITHWHMLLFGSQGAGMFNHWDIMQSASWQVQVRGRKLWHICSPDNTRLLYGAGKVDCFDPDYDAFPLMREARCFLDVVEEGEFVFYPAGYWHQTENLGKENIAVSGSVIDANCYKAVVKEFERECSSTSKRFAFTPAVCAALNPKCYQWWENAFTGSFTAGTQTCAARYAAS